MTDFAFSDQIFCLCGRFDVQCVHHLKHFYDERENMPQNNGKRSILTAVGLRFFCQYKGLTPVFCHEQKFQF